MTIAVRAHAKINLDLRILGRRPDGYHELRTIFQSVALHDTVTVAPSAGAFRIRCRAKGVPTDDRNLIWKAAQALWSAARRDGHPRGVTATLVKRIPIQGGLGGGSSDAAAALVALKKLWRIRGVDLMDIAAGIGADVPFFLHGGTALGLGRGDEIYPLAEIRPHFVALLVPPFGVPTADAYKWVDAWPRRPELPRSFDPANLGVQLQNDFESAIDERHSFIPMLRERLLESGAIVARLSGSGSAVFGLFTEENAAKKAVRACRNLPCRSILTRTISRREIG